MKMPDVTPAQIVALVGAILAVAVAFGAPIDDAQRDAILQLASIVAPALVIGDAVIRNGRSRIAAAQAANPAPAGEPAPDRAAALAARVSALEAKPATPDLLDLQARVVALEAAEGAVERPEA